MLSRLLASLNLLNDALHLFVALLFPFKMLTHFWKVREEMAYVQYASKPSGGLPVALMVTLPGLTEDGNPRVIKPETACIWGDLEMMSKTPEDREKIITLVPGQGTTLEKLSLRMKLDEAGEDVFRFEKLGEDEFSMSVQHPLSLIQGFGICLSLFDASTGAIYGRNL